LSGVLFTSSLTFVLADTNQANKTKIKSKIDIVKPIPITPNLIKKPVTITPKIIKQSPPTKPKIVNSTTATPPNISKSIPVKPTPIHPTPIKPTPIKPTPVTPTPIKPTPIPPTPIKPTPVKPTPIQPTPINPTPIKPLNLDLSGHWGGSFSMKDTTADGCTFSGSWEATLKQNGNVLSGSFSIIDSSSPDYPANDFCTLTPGTFNFAGGTVTSSSFQFDTAGVGEFHVKGYFTSNLIHGNFNECYDESCASGSFTGSRG